MLFGRQGKIAIIAVILSCFIAFAAHAEGERDFDLPAARLAESLKRFGQQAGIQIIFAPEAVGEQRAPSVHGHLQPVDALRELLKGTGLVFERAGEKLFVIHNPVTGLTIGPACGDCRSMAPEL